MKKDNFTEIEKSLLKSFSTNGKINSNFYNSIFIKDGDRFFYNELYNYDADKNMAFNRNAHVVKKVITPSILSLLTGLNVNHTISDAGKYGNIGLGQYIQVTDEEFINISIEELEDIICNIN